MKYIRTFLASLVLMFSVNFALVPAMAVHADAKSDVCDSLGGCTNNTNGSTDVNKVIRLVINILSVVVGVTAVIMIILAGMKFITSGGDPGSVKSARSALLYAIIGLAIVGLAQLIVHFVLAKTSHL